MTLKDENALVNLSFPSGFRDELRVRLGLGVGMWLELNFKIGILFQDQENMLTRESA